jgi:CubicO group peptidase (beta-lactamase class C family)
VEVPVRRRGAAAIAAAALVTACITEPELKPGSGWRPADVQDGWQIATPEQVGLDPRRIDAAYARFYSDREYLNAIAFLIVRDGRLVAEGYTRSPEDRERIGNVQSVTKSITSIVFGTLVDDGTFGDLNEPMSGIFDPSVFGGDPRARNITLGHLLTMLSGLELDNRSFSRLLLMRQPRNQDRILLSQPMTAPPGTRFDYRDADPQILSYAVTRRTGRTLESLARERLFEPLGIRDFYWEANADGITLGAHALWLGARDMARIGQMVLNGGTWNGRRIVSAEWIARSTSTRVNQGVGAGPRYGFYWWVIPEANAFVASGHGGQYILVLPRERTVAVVTALPDTNDERLGNSLPAFIDLVRTAVGAGAAAPSVAGGS